LKDRYKAAVIPTRTLSICYRSRVSAQEAESWPCKFFAPLWT